MNMNKKSVTKFFNGDGSGCPSCGAGDVQGGSIDVEGLRLYQRCSCAECGAEFTICASVDTIMGAKCSYEVDWQEGKPIVNSYST